MNVNTASPISSAKGKEELKNDQKDNQLTTSGRTVETEEKGNAPKIEKSATVEISPNDLSKRIIEHKKSLEQYMALIEGYSPFMGDEFADECIKQMQHMEESMKEQTQKIKEHTASKVANVVKQGGKKHRLFLGEATLSFTLAFIKKHPATIPYITATTYEKENELEDGCKDNKQEIIKLGVDENAILHGVDAKTLHSDSRFKDKVYGHIHWNYPYAANDKTTAEVIEGFFDSARSKLTHDGHIHMALVSRTVKWMHEGEEYQKDYQGKAYKTVNAAFKNGYILLKKHHMHTVGCTTCGEGRYPGYVQKSTNYAGSTRDDTLVKGREYVFGLMDFDGKRLDERLNSYNGYWRYLPEEVEGNKGFELWWSNASNEIEKRVKQHLGKKSKAAKIKLTMDNLKKLVNKKRISDSPEVAKLLKKYIKETGRIENFDGDQEKAVKTKLLSTFPKYWSRSYYHGLMTDNESSDYEDYKKPVSIDEKETPIKKGKKEEKESSESSENLTSSNDSGDGKK